MCVGGAERGLAPGSRAAGHRTVTAVLQLCCCFEPQLASALKLEPTLRRPPLQVPDVRDVVKSYDGQVSPAGALLLDRCRACMVMRLVVAGCHA